MKNVLTKARRLFLAGSLSLVIFAILIPWVDNHNVSTPIAIYEAFFLFSPAIYLILLIISTFIMRQKNQRYGWFSTLLDCIGSDFTSPSQCISDFHNIGLRSNTQALQADTDRSAKADAIGRFVWLLVVTAICVGGFFVMNQISIVSLFR